jgi:hypothetical protein
MAVYPDYPAPIGRKGANGDPELAIARYGVTNIRNVKSPHWRGWLGPANRCVVPATSFSEYGQHPDPVTKKKRHCTGLRSMRKSRCSGSLDSGPARRRNPGAAHRLDCDSGRRRQSRFPWRN